MSQGNFPVEIKSLKSIIHVLLYNVWEPGVG